MDLANQDVNRSLNESGYMFGKGRDSVVNKSNQMKREGVKNQFGIISKRSFENNIEFLNKPEPLALNFPFTDTYKVDMDNYKEKTK